MRSLFRTLLSLSVVHWLTSIGVVLTTASAVVFLALVFQRFGNPYVGIVVILVLPALFVAGLMLIPLGILLAARRLGGYRNLLVRVPVDSARASRLAWAFAFATLANAGIIALAAHQGVEHMDSKEFCGQTCHVMQPQYARYQESPHARIACVDCHVGSGASSFIQYKLAGARQVFRLVTDTYHRPILPALESLRPATDTCEQCHSPQRVYQDKLKLIRHYANDEQSTGKTTVLLMRTGSKIHKAHAGSNIEYVASGSDRQTIATVAVNGKTYALEGAAAGGPARKMDCMDCHNRSGHDFETPESLVDRDIASGKLGRTRPYARRDAVAAMKGQSPFPIMSILWDSYPSNVGHDRFPGCFRCHDGQHVTTSGESIAQDCASCHELIAVEEQNPEILKALGLQ